MATELTARHQGKGTAHGKTPYRRVRANDEGGSANARRATWAKLPESLNFVTEENEVWRTKHAQLQYTNRSRWWTSRDAREPRLRDAVSLGAAWRAPERLVRNFGEN